MMLVVELIEDELDIEPIHRLLDLPDDVDLVGQLRDAFDLAGCGVYSEDAVDSLQRRMAKDHGLGIVVGSNLYLAIAKPEMRVQALADEDPAVAATDAAVVEAMVVPRLPGAAWRYWHDANSVAAQVDKGAADAAILCSPVSVAQTRAAATRRAPHAPEDHVLRAQTAVGHGLPASLRPRPCGARSLETAVRVRAS